MSSETDRAIVSVLTSFRATAFTLGYLMCWVALVLGLFAHHFEPSWLWVASGFFVGAGAMAGFVVYACNKAIRMADEPS